MRRRTSRYMRPCVLQPVPKLIMQGLQLMGYLRIPVQLIERVYGRLTNGDRYATRFPLNQPDSHNNAAPTGDRDE
jgi:hypothetical protein